MKDLKAFMETVAKNPKLAQRVESAKNTAEIVAIAADEGFTFTENELMDERMSQVAGGGRFRSMLRSVGSAAGRAIGNVAKDAGEAAIGVVSDAAVGGLGKAADKLAGIGSGGPTIATPAAGEEWAPSDLFGGE